MGIKKFYPFILLFLLAGCAPTKVPYVVARCFDNPGLKSIVVGSVNSIFSINPTSETYVCDDVLRPYESAEARKKLEQDIQADKRKRTDFGDRTSASLP